MATQPRAYALSGFDLIAFHPGNPTGGTSIAITGVALGETLVGIDFRPQNGMLYGLGVNAAANTATLYAISTRTGLAAAIGAPGSISLTTDGVTPVDFPAGARYGFDFNPVADRVRVTSENGLNFRINPNTGTAVDSDVGIPGTNPDGTTALADAVAAAAYTNSQPNATTTTLYTLSASQDRLNIQNPPNNGTQIAVGQTGGDFTAVNGFDIAAGANAGLALLTIGGTTGLYNINLSSGAATKIGDFLNGATPATGLAIQNDLGGIPIVALSASGAMLVRFNSATPGTATSVPITGITAGEQLVGVDFRPQTGQLYAFGVNAAADTGTLYVLDPQTGAATAVGAPGQVAFVTPIGAAVDLPSGGWGMDFSPTVDRIRITSESGLNFRINPNSGAPVDSDVSTGGINPDPPISGLPAGSLGIAAVAYTNNYGQPLVGGVSTQYTLDSVSNALFIQNPPNAGTQFAQFAITVGGKVLDFTGVNGFDIPSDVVASASGLPAVGFGYAGLRVGGVDKLYKINLATGVAVDLGFLPAQIAGLTLADAPATTATTDFNRDGMGDVLWRHTDGTVVSWMLDHAGGFAGKALGAPDNGWKVAETGDFNRDGFADVLWRHADGTVVQWFLNASGVAATQTLGAPDNNWRVAESGDFNGDGRSDILWRHDDGTVVTWLIGASGVLATSTLGGPDNTWRIAGAGDFNADGYGDVLWRNAGSGGVVLWELHGGVLFTRSLGGPENTWQIEDTPDTNADGRSDILWRNVNDGSVVAWQLTGEAFTPRAFGGPDNNWQINSDPTDLL